MKAPSARCSRAAGPRRNEKREPASRAPVSKSRPSGAPRSTWSRGAKSKARGVPQRRTSTLPVSSAPAGTPGCGRLGSAISRACNSAWMASSRSADAFSASPMPCTSAIAAEASSPRPRAWPICLESWLRRACSSSVRVCTALRSASMASKRATSRKGCGDLRASSRATTPARSLRSRVMSSMAVRAGKRNEAAPAGAAEGAGL